MKAVKLVPIEAGAAGECAREGRATGAGYYATVNARVADYPRAVAAANTLRDGLQLAQIYLEDGAPHTALDVINRTLQASTPPPAPAAQLAGFLRALCGEFPGLVNGDDDVNGGDLVDWISERLQNDEFDLLGVINA